MIYTVLNITNTIFETILFFMYLGYFLRWKSQKHIVRFSARIVFFSLVAISNIFIKTPVIMAVLSIIICYIATLFFNNKLTKKILLIFSYMILLLIAELFAVAIMLIGNATVKELLADANMQRMLGTVISKIILLCLIKIVSIFANKSEREMYLNYWLALLTIPAVNLFLLMTITAFLYDINKAISVPIMITVVSVMYTTMLSFYLFDKIIGLSGDNQLLGEQIHNQTDYSKFEAEQVENIKSIKHDFINHLQVLYKMLYYNEAQKAKQYLIDLNVIKDVEDNSINTGNISLDTVLSSKIHIAKNKGIKVSTNIIVPEKLPIDSVDECIIFGNLLDNAIEACEKMNNREKTIDVSVKYNGKYLLCNIENPTIDKVKYGKKSLVTTKSNKNEHGIGTKNINRIVKKYNGTIKYSVKDGKFNAELMLFLD